jgi:hypothetical protein
MLCAFDVTLEALLDGELYFCAVNIAFRVVHGHNCFGGLIWQINVLLELCLKSAIALADAAPRLNLVSLLLLVILFVGNRGLSDHKHLLELHIVVRVEAVKLDLDEVLDLRLGVFPLVVVLEEHGRWDFPGKLE